jgi:hypothetical protein
MPVWNGRGCRAEISTGWTWNLYLLPDLLSETGASWSGESEIATLGRRSCRVRHGAATLRSCRQNRWRVYGTGQGAAARELEKRSDGNPRALEGITVAVKDECETKGWVRRPWGRSCSRTLSPQRSTIRQVAPSRRCFPCVGKSRRGRSEEWTSGVRADHRLCE